MSESELTIEVVLLHYGAKTVPGGPGWKAMRCPFHDDRTASASVNTTLNGFRCHGCEVSGDPIKIIREREGMTFGEAVEFAGEVFGASIENVSRSVPSRRKPVKRNRAKWREVLD